MTSYKLLKSTDYTKALIKSIDRSKHRIDMIALVIKDDDATHGIIDALCRASRRGVRVSIGMDIYFTFKELGLHSSKWSYFVAQLRNMRATKRRLEQNGASVRWLGQFGATLFSRRTHTKWSVVDDTVFSFGGVNLYDAGIASNDYMFQVKDERLAERMRAEHELVINTDKAGRSYPSHSFGTKGGAVLVDGGRMFDSIIYRRACNLAEQADRVVYVSQYCPTGRLSRILKRTSTEYFYNPWQNADDQLNALLIRVSSFVHNIQTLYTKDQYLHGKFMLFYMVDGSVVAITGSHNFVSSGGTMGTREVALETRDASIIRQLEEFLAREVMVK
ncbi:MAG TPA: phospholipase D-like domain-containing protein [Patescibacteria group bacterium]|nr:phospholipase D-like domain-containing protein [Patescibacteria group bacterium]